LLFSGALSRRPGTGSSLLGMANAAIESLTKALALELAPRLRANCISPGLTRTEAFAGMPAEAQEAMFKGFGASIPAQRSGEATDLGEASASLMLNGWITGVVLDVDGGKIAL
jgi:NAD(P)-dependent dehydrogenase (short-subunit alcohol dehydrogenase family)